MNDNELHYVESPLVIGKGKGTPEEHALIVRDERFCRQDRPARWWCNNDPVATAWFNSVSASLPRGEAFFIETLKNFRDELPAGLDAAVKAFVRQEVNHTREHLAFNRYVEDNGYNVASIDRGIADMLALTGKQPREVNLAICIALEHFAASIGHELLTDPRYLAGAEHEAAELWRWHAIEEIEHKALIHDIWLHVTAQWSAWRRWKVLSLVALAITRRYLGNRVRDAVDLMGQDGIPAPEARRRLRAWLWRKPGLLRHLLGHWSRILLPGFHPWNFDNGQLVRDYKRAMTLAMA